MSLLLAFDEDLAWAGPVARDAGLEAAAIERHRFPDGESRLRLPAALPADVVILRGLQQPNDRLAELLLVAGGARELGARRVVLACPYLGYMRQDMAFTPGEVVSQRHIGRLLAGSFDAVVTVDPHLHRIERLEDVIHDRPCRTLSAAPLLGAWVARQVPQACLIGPDAESAQWVLAAAAGTGLDHAVCVKQRRGDRDVDVALPQIDVRGRAAVVLDDVASTGTTLLQAARGLIEAGAASVDVAVTHGLFVGEALPRLRAAGVRHVWSADSVPHTSNAVSVQPLIAQALRELLDGAPR